MEGAVKFVRDAANLTPMSIQSSHYHGYRFPPETIAYAVWLYHRFCLSFRDVEELLAERGTTVSYEAVRQWCLKFGREFAGNLRPSMAPVDFPSGDLRDEGGTTPSY